MLRAIFKDFGEMGFVILHRCGRDFYFLLVCTWQNGNELWESVYAKKNDAETDFAEFPLAATHRATFCVWELAIVWHEHRSGNGFCFPAAIPPPKVNICATIIEALPDERN